MNQLDLGFATDGYSIDAVRDLREHYLPDAFANSDAEVLVAGEPASELDFHELAARYQPIVFSLVLGLSFLLLVVACRSLVAAAGVEGRAITEES
jgi:putative drug exporter of the RND superfamily